MLSSAKRLGVCEIRHGMLQLSRRWGPTSVWTSWWGFTSCRRSTTTGLQTTCLGCLAWWKSWPSIASRRWHSTSTPTTTARQLLEVTRDTILSTRSDHCCHRRRLRLRGGTVPGKTCRSTRQWSPSRDAHLWSSTCPLSPSSGASKSGPSPRQQPGMCVASRCTWGSGQLRLPMV